MECGADGGSNADSLTYLPMPDAVVITFLAPTITGFACSVIPSLREPFTRAEMFGGLVSLFGVTLIARPEFLFVWFGGGGGEAPENDEVVVVVVSQIPAITPAQRVYAVSVALVGVFGAATAYTTIRWIGKRAHPLVSVTYFSGLVTAVSVAVLTLVPSTGGFIVPRGGVEWGLLTAIGVSGFAMQFLLTRGLQLTKAGRAGMMVYTQMVFALVFEWLVWANTPDGLSVAGGGLILGSVLFVNFWKAKKTGAAKGGGEGGEGEGVGVGVAVVAVVVDEERGLLGDRE